MFQEATLITFDLCLITIGYIGYIPHDPHVSWYVKLWLSMDENMSKPTLHCYVTLRKIGLEFLLILGAKC